MYRRIRTSIRDQGRLFVALAAITLIMAATIGLAAALGDQRRIAVVLAEPGAEASVPATIREAAVTFSGNPDHASVEARLKLEPPAPGVVRWRGRTLEYVFTQALTPGRYTLTVGAGAIGVAGERLAEDYRLAFVVRQPGVLVVAAGEGGDGQRLVAELPGQPPRELLRAGFVRDVAVAPDGSAVAAVVTDGDHGRLVLIDTATWSTRNLVDDANIEPGQVAWSSDAAQLLVVRRDRLADGTLGVPRTWLVRLSGEFVGLIDPSGEPNSSPSWSPDAQRVAYVAPATTRLVVHNLSTQEDRSLGVPRGYPPAWSPDGRLVAFETVPTGTTGTVPPQPVRVVSVDGSQERTFGVEGEVRSAPRFLDNDTLISLRRTVGPQSRGTELVFESVSTGQVLRAIQLSAPNDAILTWDIDPSRTTVVFAIQGGTQVGTITLNLETGERGLVPVSGERVAWLP